MFGNLKTKFQSVQEGFSARYFFPSFILFLICEIRYKINFFSSSLDFLSKILILSKQFIFEIDFSSYKIWIFRLCQFVLVEKRGLVFDDKIKNVVLVLVSEDWP